MATKKEEAEMKKAAEEISEGIGEEDKALIEKSMKGEITEMQALGLENFDPSMFPPPRIKLVQPSTKGAETPGGDEIPAGKLWNTVSGESFDELECTFLKGGVTRAMFEKGEFDKPPICFSRDGSHGPSGEYCPDCEYSQWTDEPPRCKKSIEFIGITKDGEVFVIRFSGTSFKHAHRFIGKVRYSHKPLFAHKVRLAPEKKSGSAGKYWELKIYSEGIRDIDEVKELYEDYIEFGRAFMPRIQEDERDE